ncbi:non-ribosomal peptide synthase domain TIGR01720/amino acid adenylation domain-containing protein [Hyunsoonleella jejuensis]|uniref:Non-ribosomal peptide synthase domain TIGR01720/amino acid adenylation domain-containing protein n=1 Tax=Hyunsoonleella jejuensis TaxID=419940 RepID=A0A1H9KJD3_9FLAO|nr:non-ribosomal peptide synthetase [Hyunsoonleella jejuensis]SEQ99271.1 non-ribosomal peptide synthase domain TIGR01720/amino acid adenylation domain-containing protein [Hyunsoonleella jejuensis]
MRKENSKTSLLSKWKNRKKASENKVLGISKAPNNSVHPLSYAQKRLWFLQQLYPENPFYNLCEYYVFEGNLDKARLNTSILTTFKKHRILSSYYSASEGLPILNIDTSIEPQLIFKDLTNLKPAEADIKCEEMMSNESHKAFNLSTAPLYKIILFKLNDEKHILFFKFHHIISDQWSMQNLRSELAEAYKKPNTEQDIENQVDFIDYAYWQNNNQTFEEPLSYWKKKLGGDLPKLNLPLDFKRPYKISYRGDFCSKNISKDLSLKALNMAKELRVTPFVLFLSVYYLVLHLFTKQEKLVIGTPSSNRDEHGLDNAFGFFIDTLVLKQEIDKSQSFIAFIESVNQMFTEALLHKSLPFDILINELDINRDLSINPVFQTMFVYSSKPKLPDFGDDLKLVENSEYIAKVSKFDLTLFVTETNSAINVTFEYNTDIFKKQSISRFIEYYEVILSTILNQKEARLSEMPSRTVTDHQIIQSAIPEFQNALKNYSAIHHIIEEIATKTPETTAVTFKDIAISYKTLNIQANNIAQRILETNSEGQIVGLCIERSVDMIVGMLGILKAGKAYLPIDPDYPVERIKFILEDAQVKSIVTQDHNTRLFEEQNLNFIIVDGALKQTECIINLPKVEKTDLAYVIYTSGSTGQPKGVPITHENIINSTAGRLNFYDNNPDVFLLMSSISFDSSKAGIFWTLCTGGNLVLTEKRIEQDIDKIANTISSNNVTHTLMLPSLYQIILENIDNVKLQSLNTVIVAGESCSKDLCNAHFNLLTNVALYNEYGPTEATVWCIAHKIKKTDLLKPQIPIGKPVANSTIYILDKSLNQLPIGVPGEIYVAGANLSKGYINRADLTNNVFIDNPFIKRNKIYKTGDIAKFDNDGIIEFLGRADQQIKIRGYRVEIDDIENVINNTQIVEKCVVIVKQNTNGTKRLVGYIKPKKAFNQNELKAALIKELPNYMIPSSFVIVNKIPLLPNGKVNKKALENYKIVEPEGAIKIPEQPKNETERKLLSIWKEVLSVDSLNTDDNFFEVGGDSILSIQIIAKARKEGLSIAPNQIFEHQTISELAMFVSSHDLVNSRNESITSGKIPLLPIQKWFFETHKNAPEYWNQGFNIKGIPDNIDAVFLEQLTKKLIGSHDALRSSFSKENSEWYATILTPEDTEPFIEINLSSENAANYNLKIEESLKEIQEGIKLEKGSLFKCIYFNTGKSKSSCIVLLAHHLVIDFVSWQIVLDYYTESLLTVQAKTIINTSSIKTWGDYLENLAESNAIQNELSYWKEASLHQNKLPKDFECTLPILEKDINHVNTKIDKSLTQNLINKANEAYNTKIDELLLTAFTSVLLDWTNHEIASISIEKHGRETGDTNIDLSNTIGWFTSFFPKLITLNSNNDLGANIIAVKEQVRKIPNGGLGYGVLRYFTSQLDAAEYPEIVFNYLGHQSTKNSNIEFLSKHVRHPFSERHYFIEVNALIKNGYLNIDWSYAKNAFNRDTIKLLINKFEETLHKIVDHCVNSNDIKYTPSDFKDVDLDQDDLDTLLNDLNL